MRKLIALLAVCALCAGLLIYNLYTSPSRSSVEPIDTAEATKDTQPGVTPEPQVPAQVRIRNTDPALANAWKQLGRKYSELTGVDVVVFDGQDTQIPTLFTVADSSEISPEECVDLSTTAAFSQLADMELAIKLEGKYCALAMEIDCFGLIFNENLLAEMVTQEEIRDINGFSALVSNIAAKGYAPFAGRDLSDGVATRLASIPGDFRTLARLWAQNSGEQTDASPMDRFLSGEAVFYLGSTGEYDTLMAGGVDAMGILPIFLDPGEGSYVRQTLCISAKRYWCINASASEADVAATLDFLSWLVMPMEDGSVPVDTLELLAPYRQAKFYANPLENTLRLDLAAGKSPVVCKNLTAPPAGFTAALTAYVQDPTDENWAQVAAYLQ